MNKKIIVFFMFIFLGIGFSQKVVLAEDIDPFESFGKNSFDRVKKNIIHLRQKRKKLQKQDVFLEEEYQRLLTMSNNHKGVVEDDRVSDGTKKYVDFFHSKKEELQNNMDVLESENLMLRAKIYERKIRFLDAGYYTQSELKNNTQRRKILEEELQSVLKLEEGLFSKLMVSEQVSSIPFDETCSDTINLLNKPSSNFKTL